MQDEERFDIETEKRGGSQVLAALRWVAVLPSSIIGIVAAIFPIHWLLWLMYYFTSLRSDDYSLVTVDGKPVPFFGIPLDSMERMVRAAVLPALFIVIGTWVAPAWKWTTAVLLAVCFAILMTIGLTAIAVSDELVLEPTITQWICLALHVAGVWWALNHVYQRDRRSKALAKSVA